jgi:copper chaperone CopZ
VAEVKEVVQVRGIRCERCMARLGHVLKDHDGLESVNADFQGNVTLVYDDQRTDREALVSAMQRGGFSEIAA